MSDTRKLRESLAFKIILIVVLVIVWILWARSASCSNAGTGTKTEVSQVLPGDVRSLDVEVSSAEIRVTVSSSATAVTVNASGRRLGDGAINVETQKNGSYKVTVPVANRNWLSFWKKTARLETLEVVIPASLTLESLKAVTASGSLKADTLQCASSITLRCVSGRIDAGTLNAPQIDLQCTSGSIHCSVLRASAASVEDTSGSINIGLFTGPELELRAVSGSINLGGAEGLKKLIAKDTSGTVTLNLGAVDPDIEASTTSGSIYANGVSASRKYSRTGNGSCLVEATSVSGSVKLTWQ